MAAREGDWASARGRPTLGVCSKWRFVKVLHVTVDSTAPERRGHLQRLAGIAKQNGPTLRSSRSNGYGGAALPDIPRYDSFRRLGVVAERFKAAVLKTAKGESPS
jgi:hypothetical protein